MAKKKRKTTPMDRCTVCTHPNRKEIEAALLIPPEERPTLVSLAKSYGVSRHALSNHLFRHMKPEKREFGVRVAEVAEEWLRRLDEHWNVMDGLVRSGESPLNVIKAAGVASGQAREAREYLRLLSELSGALGNSAQVVIVVPPKAPLGSPAPIIDRQIQRPD